MKKYASIIFLYLFSLVLFSCVDEDEHPNSPQGNFEALWRIIDEHYCFFDYKKAEYGLDWDEVRNRYAKQIDEGMTTKQQFEVLTNMLAELRDGHVNLYTTFDIGRYWAWHEDYPSNISDTLLNIYMGTDYRIATGLRYRILEDNIGYIRCTTFSNDFGAGNLDEILTFLAPCQGLIIDLRDNSGGLLTSAEELAARFTNENTLVGYMQHKTGTAHDAFSPMEEQWLKPAKGVRWQKRTAVLTNRSVFSAANEFVKYMKCCPNVTIIGDKTGGGAGLPFSSELPNGWSVRFSACPMYDKEKNNTEFGIAPNYAVSLQDSDFQKGRDTIIEFARQWLAKRP
ncbi:MAG: S41 family peptidase [Prevotella sp.]|nr:S41 family peptidase [Prevotella sp.]